MKPKRLFRFPQKEKRPTLCRRLIHPWTPLKIERLHIHERTEAEVLCPTGNRYRVYTSEIVPFPDIVTITTDHDGHDIWTTFDFIHDIDKQRDGKVVARCRRMGILIEIPLTIVAEAGQHIPPSTAYAV